MGVCTEQRGAVLTMIMCTCSTVQCMFLLDLGTFEGFIRYMHPHMLIHICVQA